jgi:hypothetical protein
VYSTKNSIKYLNKLNFDKMKKILLSLVFVIATGVSFINATSTNDEISPTTKEAIEEVEEFGCASDCNSLAREGALALSSNHDDRVRK